VSRLGELIVPPPSVGRDRDDGPALGNQRATVFVIDSAKPGLALIEVGLIAGRTAVFHSLRAELNPRVCVRDAADPELDREVEIGERAVPKEELVMVESLSGGNLTGDGAILDAPVDRVAGPALKRFAVKERLSRFVGGGRQSRQQRQQRCNEER